MIEFDNSTILYARMVTKLGKTEQTQEQGT